MKFFPLIKNTGSRNCEYGRIPIGLNCEENVADVGEPDCAVIGTEEEEGKIVGRVADFRQAETGIDALRQKHVEDVRVTVLDRKLRRRGMDDGKNVVLAEHVGLECLID